MNIQNISKVNVPEASEKDLEFFKKELPSQSLSLLPAGLHRQLSAGELSELIAYLRSLPDGSGYLRNAKNPN